MDSTSKCPKVCEEAAVLHAEIFDSGKFWKLAQSKNAAVKGSWFALVGTLAKMINTFPPLSAKHKEKIASAVFNQLDDWTDPVLATRWVTLKFGGLSVDTLAVYPQFSCN